MLYNWENMLQNKSHSFHFTDLIILLSCYFSFGVSFGSTLTFGSAFYHWSTLMFGFTLLNFLFHCYYSFTFSLNYVCTMIYLTISRYFAVCIKIRSRTIS